MNIKSPNVFSLEDPLDLRKLENTGSLLHINEHIDDSENTPEVSSADPNNVDFVGHAVENFATLSKTMINIRPEGIVKKKIIEEGGGLPIEGPCTVFIAVSGYFNNALIPFHVHSLRKPLEVNLTMTAEEDHGLIPGLDIAVKSMLVGELSLFLFSHEVAFGEHGMPPRIPPKAQCAFFVKLVKKIFTPKNGKLNYSESNMFGRVEKEVLNHYGAGYLLYKSNNFSHAANVFRRAISMLHRCRLADEMEERKQEKWLKKLYFNSALCYNKMNQPLKACTACNELNRLQSLWNNGRALFQNAKALRMIGQYNAAEKRLKRAMALCTKTHNDDLKAEMELLIKTRESCNQSKLIGMRIADKNTASNDFKKEVDILIRNFKENVNLCQLSLPSGLNSTELRYLKEVCIRENLFIRSFDAPLVTVEENDQDNKSSEPIFAIDKEDNRSNSDGKSDISYGVEGEVDHQKLMTGS